jgi:chromosome segregation ATPase
LATPKTKEQTPTPNNHGSVSTVVTSPVSDFSDDQKLRQSAGGGLDATIQQLREELKEAMSRDASAKAALSKSDAVILDLRSNQRQLKRQLDLLQEERAEMNKELQKAKENAGGLNGFNNSTQQQQQQQQQQIESLEAHIQEITKQLEESQRRQQHQDTNNSAHSRGQPTDNNKNEKVGELQVQLDRAHAQILTADMVRKELEDTLEAEQYTWDLRVQDQERQIERLQQECDTIAQDLDQCRSQWKEAEVGWTQELNELKEDLSRARHQLQQPGGTDNAANNNLQDDLFQKIRKLESERAELQSCLDEALKELEAVDEELQPGNNDQITESLKHLLRWIYQEGPVETRVGQLQLSSLDNNPQEILSLVQKALEGWLEATSQTDRQNFSNGARARDQHVAIAELNNQISVYEEELKNRDGASAELRESLKEAVTLLKPLQDAVAQTEEEKNGMQRQLQDLEKDRQSSQDEIVQQSRRINILEDRISDLGEQLEEEKKLSSARGELLKAQAQHTADSTISSNSNDDNSLTSIKRAREELRRKRETEANLQKLLKDAQSRFNTLHDRNENMNARNRELQGKIEKIGSNGEEKHRDQGNGSLAAALAQKEEELRVLQLELERMRSTASSQDGSAQKNAAMEEELNLVRKDVVEREQVNRVLNKSLKEALGLLKPLQMHLEEAESEKAEISKELRNLRKRFRQLQMGETDDQSRSTLGGGEVTVELIKVRDELEETVRQLELENSQLYDALDDMTEDGRQYSTEAKLRQRLVELNSRYEVTQNQLEDSHVENSALVKALKEKEIEDKRKEGDIIQLEEALRNSEAELLNAKKIAQSALVKVEELTMSNKQRGDNLPDDGFGRVIKSPGNGSIQSPGNQNKYAGSYSFR